MMTKQRTEKKQRFFFFFFMKKKERSTKELSFFLYDPCPLSELLKRGLLHAGNFVFSMNRKDTEKIVA